MHQQLTEVEMTAWILIGIFLAVLLMFSYLFWKRISRDVSWAYQSRDPLPVAVCEAHMRAYLFRASDLQAAKRLGGGGTASSE
jgi:hypothetical protein